MCLPVVVNVSDYKNGKRLSLGLTSCAVSHANSTQAEDRHGAWLGDLAATATTAASPYVEGNRIRVRSGAKLINIAPLIS